MENVQETDLTLGQTCSQPILRARSRNVDDGEHGRPRPERSLAQASSAQGQRHRSDVRRPGQGRADRVRSRRGRGSALLGAAARRVREESSLRRLHAAVSRYRRVAGRWQAIRHRRAFGRSGRFHLRTESGSRPPRRPVVRWSAGRARCDAGPIARPLADARGACALRTSGEIGRRTNRCWMCGPRR